jgi:transposase
MNRLVSMNPPSSSRDSRTVAVVPPVLPDDPVILKQMIRELLDSLADQQREMEGIQHRLHLLLQRLYGPRRERINPEQLLLFADALAAAAPETTSYPEEDEEPAAAGRRRPRRHGRRALPADLPRIPLVHDLTEAQKACPDCGQPRVKIGEETSSQLDYQPASLFVLEHIRPTYACSHCQGHVATAAKPEQPIDKGLPGPGLLAHVVTSKYADHLPLYRQERILERFGVELKRSTLCDWMARAAELLQPLYDRMIEQVLQASVIHTDDTPVAVQDPTQDQTKTGRLWVYLGDDAHPVNVFDYSPNRRRDGPATFLKDFQGYLQADAFSGYDGIYLTQPVIEVGCNAHARRKFFEAKTTDAVRAHQALAFYRQLYDVEHEAAKNADKELARRWPNEPDLRRVEVLHAERFRWRQEKSVPIVKALEQWLKDQQADVLPKSPMGQAIGYARNHWTALTRYTQHGFLAIDNNWAEREMKRIAIGRKNWLFLGSDRGGRTAAVLFSFVSSCQRHGLDPFRYLEDVLYRLPGLPAERLEDLLPDRWPSPRLGDPPTSARPQPAVAPRPPSVSLPGPAP